MTELMSSDLSEKPRKSIMGRSKLESLAGVREAIARTYRAMRDGKRNTKIGKRLVEVLYKLAQVIEMEREARIGLHDVSLEVMRDEILRRREEAEQLIGGAGLTQ
jgi:hypothetical protein